MTEVRSGFPSLTDPTPQPTEPPAAPPAPAPVPKKKKKEKQGGTRFKDQVSDAVVGRLKKCILSNNQWIEYKNIE